MLPQTAKMKLLKLVYENLVEKLSFFSRSDQFFYNEGLKLD